MRYVLLAVALIACSDATGPVPTVAGTYALASAYGRSLPVQVWTNTSIVSGTMDLRDDGTWTETINFREGTQNLRSVGDGTYTASSEIVAFVLPYGASFIGTVTNGSLTSTEGQYRPGYRRE